MKKLGCAIVVAGLIGTPAFAADIATKAPAPAPAPVYNWTGWYVGVNAGASFGRAQTDFNVAPIFVPQIAPPSQITPGLAGTDIRSPSGFIGGGQIGYNWQYSPLIVVGLEADIQGALERDTGSFFQNFTGFHNGPPQTADCGETINATCTSLANYTTQIEWFGTARGRIGYLWGNGAVLTYLTGGLAYGEVKVNGTNNVSGASNSSFGRQPFSLIQNFGHSQVNTGWVVGYGTEGVIDFWGARNWTWKIEGLYMDLGHVDTTGVTVASDAGPFFSLHGGQTGGQVTTHSHFTDGILRAGLNYKFY